MKGHIEMMGQCSLQYMGAMAVMVRLERIVSPLLQFHYCVLHEKGAQSILHYIAVSGSSLSFLVIITQGSELGDGKKEEC